MPPATLLPRPVNKRPRDIPFLEDIDEYEQAKPYDVDKVPIPGDGFETEMVVRAEVTFQTTQDNPFELTCEPESLLHSVSKVGASVNH